MLLWDLSFANNRKFRFFRRWLKSLRVSQNHRVRKETTVSLNAFSSISICVVSQCMTSTSSSTIQSVSDIIVIHMNKQALSQSQSGSDEYLICSSRGGGRKRRTLCTVERDFYQRQTRKHLNEATETGRMMHNPQPSPPSLLLERCVFVHSRFTFFHYK